ncbi:MAG: hypothetical protein F9K38_14785 [Pseudorhodoplanes sp.]|nr:MAG: hypothetical protein F9K38_14785 [Pseudorhodoplanes sp.]
MTLRLICLSTLISLAMTAVAGAQAQAPAQGATLLGQYGDWGAYAASPGGRKVCFALAKPVAGETNPPNRRNETMSVHLFVSSRPAEKVKDEVSLLISGYTFKPSVDATIQIGNATFPMYTQKDGAWIKNAAEEARLVEAMRKSGDMTIKAVTERGTETIDRFSMKGVDQALSRVAQECR